MLPATRSGQGQRLSAVTVALLFGLLAATGCRSRSPASSAPDAPPSAPASAALPPTSSPDTEMASTAPSASSSAPGEPTVGSWIQQIQTGTPQQKEAALNHFMRTHDPGLVPAVIEAVLDDGGAPRHGDTGWATVHHQAATALCQLAKRVDGKTQKERGLDDYSFFNDGGVGTEPRRKKVHANWKAWWERNEAAVRALPPLPPEQTTPR